MPDPVTSPASVEAALARKATVAAWAVFAIFVLNGFNFASWASRLVGVRNSLGLKETEMGMLLLFVAFGSIIALPLSGWIMERLGARRTIVVFAAVNVVGYSIAAWAIAQGDVAVLRVALVLVGIGTAVWDAAMNLEGAIVEQAVGRTIMPRLHAGFSLAAHAQSGAAVNTGRHAHHKLAGVGGDAFTLALGARLGDDPA